MAPKEPCAKYQYVVTSSGPKILPVPDEQSKDEESPADYNAGGYLPVKIDDTFKDGRYVVARKLGWGHFSTVWLVKDTNTSRFSALKVVKSASRYAETARDEIKLLSQVADANPLHEGRLHIVSFLDSFTHSGPEDVHVCIVFEPLGENLLALIERNKKKGVPQPLVKTITKQVLLGLQYLHEECDLVHTDIKPENILISIPDVESHIHAELSISPTPTSRHVGVPQPTKSRSGVSIPYRRAAGRERHVQIFDSQPISSPSSQCGSISASVSNQSLHKHFVGSPVKSPMPAQTASYTTSLVHRGITRDESSLPPSPSTSSTVSSSSILQGVRSIVSTPPTSIGSTDAPVLFKIASMTLSKVSAETKEESVGPAFPNSSIKYSPNPPSPLIPVHTNEVVHAASGPSLLTQTAPGQLSNASLGSISSSSSPTPRPPSPLPYVPISIKIADLGNATPSKRHYTEDIQTRQYRAPEAILGRRDWGTRADIWSVACVVFELLTAEFLFDPHGQGELFTKDDDHMAQIIELMGDFPLEVKMGGKYSRELFDHSGALRYIKTLKPWPLHRVMTEKYLFSEPDTKAFCGFLEPMLVVDQRGRKEAHDMLVHPWLEVKDEEWAGLEEW
ncbi:kinase-like protein [Hygrophoropsis aurantiaca]|uniref:Kinase-like protein n=1 Tax=Hygrophoropsis aurantiaca TaxID=72124 RepID=A0ACB8API1_9AGAM|nr:kinase-like protein [Hygrophoropsis aurantiaca]